MTDLDLAALRKVALGQLATMGDRTETDTPVTGVWVNSCYHPVYNPATMLALLDEVERLRGQVIRVSAAIKRMEMEDDRGWVATTANEIREALEGSGEVETLLRPMEFSQVGYGVCPQCRRYEFIGHGPLCVPCFTGKPERVVPDVAGEWGDEG